MTVVKSETFVVASKELQKEIEERDMNSEEELSLEELINENTGRNDKGRDGSNSPRCDEGDKK